jgi:hypothetical protein
VAVTPGDVTQAAPDVRPLPIEGPILVRGTVGFPRAAGQREQADYEPQCAYRNQNHTRRLNRDAPNGGVHGKGQYRTDSDQEY